MVLAAAFGSLIGFLVISWIVPERWLVADADAARAVSATIGMVYAILVALAAIAVWEPRSAAIRSAEREATDLVEAHWAARALAPPDRVEIEGLIVGYAREVATVEFDSLRREQAPSRKADLLLNRLRAKVESVRPPIEELTKRVNDLADARQARISVADDGIPYPLWPILIGGAVVSVAFLYLFGLARTFPNALMMFVVGGMIGLMLAVLYQFEFPFSRGMAVGPDAFEDALFRLANVPPL